jgi:benzodiazapine receptor
MNDKIRGLKAVVENLKWWQVALIATGVSLLGRLSGGKMDVEEEVYTKELKQAPWAPPPWLFGPAWTINNFFLLMGLKRMLKNDDVPEKKKLLIIQAFIWVIFFSFNYVYFRKKSTILAALWTVTDAILVGSSLWLARKDKQTAATYAPLAGWTGFASTIAIYQALKNKDQALGVKALLN